MGEPQPQGEASGYGEGAERSEAGELQPQGDHHDPHRR